MIKRTSTSEQKRLHQLLISEELGNWKPSQLLHKMKQLSGETRLEDGILCQLFLQRLPANTQQILVSTVASISLDELGVLANQTLEVTPSQPSIAAIANPPSSSTAKEIEALRNQVDTLTTQLTALVNQLSIHPHSHSHSRSASPFPYRQQCGLSSS